jgi:hypothetical protein
MAATQEYNCYREGVLTMATKKQIEAAKKNIKKAQAAWKAMTSRQHSLAQPEGRKRAKPGTKGTGDFFRIVVRPKEEFTSFRNQDVGDPGHLQRLAGRRSGSWATQAWLVSKKDAHQKASSSYRNPTTPKTYSANWVQTPNT